MVYFFILRHSTTYITELYTTFSGKRYEGKSSATARYNKKNVYTILLGYYLDTPQNFHEVFFLNETGQQNYHKCVHTKTHGRPQDFVPRGAIPKKNISSAARNLLDYLTKAKTIIILMKSTCICILWHCKIRSDQLLSCLLEKRPI